MTATSSAGEARAAGFTLLELLVVLAVLALISAVAAPMLTGASQRAELRQSTALLASELRLARAEAIAAAGQSVVLVDLERRTFGPIGEPERHIVPDGVEIGLAVADSERREDGAAGIRFFPNGSSTGGAVRLDRQGRGYEVSVNWLTGRIQIAETGAAAQAAEAGDAR